MIGQLGKIEKLDCFNELNDLTLKSKLHPGDNGRGKREHMNYKKTVKKIENDRLPGGRLTIGCTWF